ncbi:hypothetical protein GLAREA_07968 [Glarea lozoyensis ATCC 20868]|uniref:Uncharacterized protein n=1 Tax=Glarea lozoyensis (strain ATCC 20868 / MF5171) TaxID=1116229 RepID=S3DBT2_GLAL2|nr:uncharacterized protein GLAREA_07968 [Glarea lozoyensis ATCC 20868]EPE24118.1 hypothetical protein GLAREA_07968 [Glarea lozoyensis ATCC 20868]
MNMRLGRTRADPARITSDLRPKTFLAEPNHLEAMAVSDGPVHSSTSNLSSNSPDFSNEQTLSVAPAENTDPSHLVPLTTTEDFSQHSREPQARVQRLFIPGRIPKKYAAPKRIRMTEDTLALLRPGNATCWDLWRSKQGIKESMAGVSMEKFLRFINHSPTSRQLNQVPEVASERYIPRNYQNTRQVVEGFHSRRMQTTTALAQDPAHQLGSSPQRINVHETSRYTLNHSAPITTVRQQSSEQGNIVEVTGQRTKRTWTPATPGELSIQSKTSAASTSRLDVGGLQRSEEGQSLSSINNEEQIQQDQDGGPKPRKRKKTVPVLKNVPKPWLNCFSVDSPTANHSQSESGSGDTPIMGHERQSEIPSHRTGAVLYHQYQLGGMNQPPAGVGRSPGAQEKMHQLQHVAPVSAHLENSVPRVDASTGTTNRSLPPLLSQLTMAKIAKRTFVEELHRDQDYSGHVSNAETSDETSQTDTQDDSISVPLFHGEQDLNSNGLISQGQNTLSHEPNVISAQSGSYHTVPQEEFHDDFSQEEVFHEPSATYVPSFLRPLHRLSDHDFPMEDVRECWKLKDQGEK